MSGLDLVACVGCFSYDVAVTDAQLWVAVGAQLRQLRLEKGISSTLALALKVGNEHLQKTFDNIEKGQAKTIRTVNAYCSGIDARLVEILQSVLPAEDLSPRAVRVARTYDAKPTARPVVDAALGIPGPSREHARQPASPAAGRTATAGGSRSKVRKPPGP
jgi:hypothetical protein